MMHIIPHRQFVPQRHRACRGSAPVEFVMALPVLLLMLILIMSVAVFSVGKLKATIGARRDAFHQRTAKKSLAPMAYNQKTNTDDIFSRSSTENPSYPSNAVNFGSVSVKQSVLGGAWDYRELLKGNGPHWDDMAKASVDGVTNQLGSLIDQFSNGFNPSMIPGLESAAGGLADSLLGNEKKSNNQYDNEQKRQLEIQKQNIAKYQNRIKELDAERDMLQMQLDKKLTPAQKELNDKIQKRQDEINNEPDPAKKKALQAMQDQDKETLEKNRSDEQKIKDRLEAIKKERAANQGLVDRLQAM
jgi:hypothetical protein